VAEAALGDIYFAVCVVVVVVAAVYKYLGAKEDAITPF